jgi:hypothetical protein
VHELLHQLAVACQRLHRFFTAQRRLCPFHKRSKRDRRGEGGGEREIPRERERERERWREREGRRE